MEKYLFLKKPVANINENNLYKIITKNKYSYLIAGKAPKGSTKFFTLYNLPFEKINEDWIDLDEFLKNCQLVGKKFYRTKELDSTKESSHAFMQTSLFEPKVVMLAICKDGFIYFDQQNNHTYILNSTYIEDGNFRLLDSKVELPFKLTKQSIRNEVVKSVDKKIQNDLFESIEF